MAQSNSTENKKLRREAKLAKTGATKFIQRWIPVKDKYGKSKFSPVIMPSAMAK